MSISSVQQLDEEFEKHRYKKLSRDSFNEVLNSKELYTLLPQILVSIFKWEEKQVEVKENNKNIKQTKVSKLIEGVWLNNEKSELLCKEYKKKSIDLITGLFDDFDYSDECLNILDLLTNDGAAIIYIPALEYSNIYKVLHDRNNLYINVVFGVNDERDNAKLADEDYILPEICKCLAVIISRRKTDYLYLWLEYDMDELDDFSDFFDNNLALTNPEDVYKETISGNRIIVKPNEFFDIVSFYTNKKLVEKKQWISKFPTKKLSDILTLHLPDLFIAVNFLSSIDNKGNYDDGQFKINYDKQTDIEGYSGEVSVEVSEFIIAMNKSGFIQNYIPNQSNLKFLKNVIIVETYISKFMPSSFKFIPSHEWLGVSESQYWSWQNSSLGFDLLILDDEVLIDNYLLAFLASETGQLAQRKALIESSDKLEAWKDIEVPVPDISKQKVISSAIKNVTHLGYELNILKEQIIKNPNKATEIDNSLKEWLVRLDKLSIDEKVIKLVEKGETDVVEFKETLSLDVKKKTKEKYIELSSLKTIAGFLNNKGGDLLIGVSDNGAFLGVSIEVNKFHKDKHNNSSFDRFLLHFKSLLKERIGAEYYPYIDYQLVDVNESKVLYVNCGKSKKPCYLDGKDFYVRTNPATEKLEGPKLVDYIQNHFS